MSKGGVDETVSLLEDFCALLSLGFIPYINVVNNVPRGDPHQNHLGGWGPRFCS